MKTLIHTPIIILFTIAFSYTSCTDDLIDESVDPVDKFTGSWQCSETGDGVNSNINVYTVIITRNPFNTSEVLIENFNQLQETATALVVNNSLFIEPQMILSNTIEIQGEGTFSEEGIQLTYTVDTGADLETFNAILTQPAKKDKELLADRF